MAAVDFAEFQWKKFSRSLAEAEAELPGSINLISYFKTIKQKLIETQTSPFSEMTPAAAAGVALDLFSWHSSSYIIAYRYLSELNYALEECRLFANEFKELNKKILPLNPSTLYFILQMRKRLKALRRKFDRLVHNNLSIPISAQGEPKERNTVKCVGFTEKDIVLIKKNSEETVVFSDVNFGRQYRCDLILRDFRLLSDGATGSTGFTSIGIVGAAGVGKSTFLKSILEWGDIKDEFSPIIRLCLSDIIQENDELVDSTYANGVSSSIVKLLLEKLGDTEAGGTSGLGIDLLLEKLNCLLAGRKYLIALDEVLHCMEFYSDLGHQLAEGEKFGDRLSHGLPKECGGVVIVVSRKPEVALDMVGLPQNSVHKRLTTIKRKSQMSTLVVEKLGPSNPGTSVSYSKVKIAVMPLPCTENAKNISNENVLLIPRVQISSTFSFEREFRDSVLLAGDPSGTGFTAIGIVGMAGVGKSTFVHKLLKTMWSEFDPIVWLCMSDIINGSKQVPDAAASTDQSISISIVACILEMLGISIDKNIGLAKLLKRLYHVLLGKRYLIVLDNVWDTMEFYSDLCYELPEGAEIGDRLSYGLPKDYGGTVIVTSRMTEVAGYMVGFGQNKLFLVPQMNMEESLSNFTSFLHHETYRCGEGKHFGTSNMATVRKVHNEILHQVSGLPSIAMTLVDSILANQIGQNEYNRSTLQKMLIPHEFIVQYPWATIPTQDREVQWVQDKTDVPMCPVCVFVDLRNDHIGSLAEDLRYLLNREQVIAVLHENFYNKYKLRTENPDMALKEIYGAFEKLKGEGHDFADEIQKKMTIIIVGEDVFINWFLGVFCNLNLPDSPAIVPIAIGIKSNIAFSFGWENDAMKPVNKILEMVLNDTKQMKTDSWHILIKMKAIPTMHQEIPYCFHICHAVHEPDTENVDHPSLIRGELWNYFSIGVDDPRLYGASRFRHISRTLNRLLSKIEVLRNHGGQWEMLTIPSSIRSIVCLNLPSFVGGLNPWTKANAKKDLTMDLTPSFIDDGLLEIIGSRDDLLSPKKRWIRLVQVREIRFKFVEASVEVVNMTIDGVALKNLPLDGLDEIEISYGRQVNVLVERGYPANSISDS